MADQGYALAFTAPHHVANTLDRAAPAALSFEELAKSHDPLGSDLTRIKRHEGAKTDFEAKLWLIRKAVSEMTGLVVDGDRVSLADGFDSVRYRGKPIDRIVDHHAQLRDPFNPMTGQFSDNIRIELGDLTELRESLRAWGWIEGAPALIDERGVVLVGHRRLAVAKELGIKPVIKTLTIGSGDAADAERFKLAIASNIGAKPLSPNDRKRIAEYLYSAKEWSQQRIAEALVVNQATIARDLSGVMHVHNSRGGRPRKAKTIVEASKDRRKITPEQEDAVGKLVEQGASVDEIKTATGLTDQPVREAKHRHIGRLEERAKPINCVCPQCGHGFTIGRDEP